MGMDLVVHRHTLQVLSGSEFMVESRVAQRD